MPIQKHNQNIINYYKNTENFYKDDWGLNNSLSMHYGYRDQKVKNFPQSLLRMNEVMMDEAKINYKDRVLDAGCGIGDSCIYLGKKLGCQTVGISLCQEEINKAKAIADYRAMSFYTKFEVMDYCHTNFPEESFNVVWACESVCYAYDKEVFIKEAFRLLKPGGRLVLVDGFVTEFSNNQDPIIKNWLQGWQINYLETPDRFMKFMEGAGFTKITYKNISTYTVSSAKRLYKLYFLATTYLFLKSLIFSNRVADIQKKNVKASKFQYLGLKNKLWQHGLVVAVKP